MSAFLSLSKLASRYALVQARDGIQAKHRLNVGGHTVFVWELKIIVLHRYNVLLQFKSKCVLFAHKILSTNVLLAQKPVHTCATTSCQTITVTPITVLIHAQ